MSAKNTSQWHHFLNTEHRNLWINLITFHPLQFQIPVLINSAVLKLKAAASKYQHVLAYLACLAYKIWPFQRFPCSGHTWTHSVCSLLSWPLIPLNAPLFPFSSFYTCEYSAWSGGRGLRERTIPRCPFGDTACTHTHTHAWRLYGRAQVQPRCGGRRTQRLPSSWVTDPNSQGHVYTSRVSAYKINHRWGVFQITCNRDDCIT